MLVGRWGIFWRPLRVKVCIIPLIITVACKLHNICIDRFGANANDIGLYHGGPRDVDSSHDVTGFRFLFKNNYLQLLA